jgi:hypothetical protein
VITADTLADSLRHDDEQSNRRTYTHAVTGDELISVTTINGATHGKPWLPDWAAKVAAQYAIDNLDALARIKVCQSPEAAVKLAKEEAKRLRDLKADAGSHVHHVIERLLIWAGTQGVLGQAVDLPELPEHLVGADYDDEPIETVIEFMLDGFINFIAAFEPEIAAAEMTVYNRDLGVAGTLDSIIVLDGYAIGRGPGGYPILVSKPGHRLILCVDVKTGRNPEYTWQEQLAAYRRMRECLLPLGDVRAMPHTDAAAVLHLRPEFENGYRLLLVSGEDDAKAWNRFRRSCELFFGREEAHAKPGKVVYPLNPDGSTPTPRLRDLDNEGYGRAPGALVKAGLRDLDALAALTEAGVRDLKGIGPKTIPLIHQMLADHGLGLAVDHALNEEAA